MTTEQYKVFYQVAEHGSISKAAKALFVSQPAVTKSVKLLEQELEVSLFVRTPKGVTLTREGEVLYDYVKEAFEQLDMGEKRIRQLKNLSYGSIRIGISNILCKYYFIPYLETFHNEYPELKIEIVNRTSPETLELLESGKIDCAIISDVPVAKNYMYYELMKVQDTFVSKTKPPKELISVEELAKYSFLMLEKKNATRQSYEHYFLEQEEPLTVDIEISSMEFLIEFAKIGLGISGVIKEFVEEELRRGQLHEWKVNPPLPPRGIGLLYKEQQPLSIASANFIDYMKTYGKR